MRFIEVTNKEYLLFESVTGSHAYGTNVEGSDVDLKGIFVLPKAQFYGLSYTPQVSDERNDETYYEIKRFCALLAASNPNMLELLAMPEECIRYKHPLFDLFKADIFLSKACEKTFAGYAMSQVQKARGLNKKINNPLPERRKSILEFCYVAYKQGSKPLLDWLEENDYKQENCGLVNIPHFRSTFALFYDESEQLGFKGITQKDTANDVLLSSIPKGRLREGRLREASMYFNKDGYQVYCKEYKQYWDWVKLRNEERYKNTIQHGKNYDTKNMMHTFRLLDMAAEIAQYGEIRVRRPNRDFLLAIRKGAFEYDDLLRQAEEKIVNIQQLYQKAKLPLKPNPKKIEAILRTIREEWYKGS